MGRKSKTNLETGMRQCVSCKAELPVSEFYRSTKRGFQSRCKNCSRKGVLEWQKQKPELANAKSAAWKRDHKDEVLTNAALYRDKNREKLRSYNRAYMQRKRGAMSPEELAESYRRQDLKRHYGITLEQYDEILAAQGGGCAICGTKEFGARRPAVDHDHITGKVRGIACHHCNTLLHKLETVSGWIEAAARYLEKYKS